MHNYSAGDIYSIYTADTWISFITKGISFYTDPLYYRATPWLGGGEGVAIETVLRGGTADRIRIKGCAVIV